MSIKRMVLAALALCSLTAAVWAEDPDIEVWTTNIGYKPIEKGSPLYNLYKQVLGVGVVQPYVEWNGGTDYLNKLNLQIAAGTIPNLFLPWNGNEAELARNGAIVDLTDLLPKHAPALYKLIPQNVWSTIKANDPTGKGRIYWVPQVDLYVKRGSMIRQDWLDKLGLKMPKTQAEYVAVLKAFRDKDPNGNKLADEVPTGGRQGARWMDHLFNMYGVAMFEGYPEWDLYNGQLTHSVVTQNAKEALVFAAQLYKDKLLDPETFLNDKSAWDGKINAGKAGNYFHWAEVTDTYLGQIFKNTGVKANLAVMPVIKAPGYESKGYYTNKMFGPPLFVVSAKQDQAHLLACLKLLNALADSSRWDDLYFAVEGMHSKTTAGKRSLLADDKAAQQNILFKPYQWFADEKFITRIMADGASAETKWMIDQDVRNINDMQKQVVRTIAGDGMPAEVYADYPDIKKYTLWQEYSAKIIMGAYPISKFDEFVEKWNQSGGAEVTKRARAWYAKIAK